MSAAKKDPDAFFQSEWPRPGDGWTLTETSVDKAADAYVGGEFGGFRVAADGTTPLGETRAPFPLEWSVGGVRLDPHLGSDYSQTLDLRDGALTTKWRQAVGETELSIETVTGEISGPDQQTWSFQSNREVEVSTPFETRNTSVHAEPGSFRLEDGKLVVQAGPSRNTVAIHAPSLMAAPRTSLLGHEGPDIVIDGPLADQQAVRSFLYYLRALYAERAGQRFSPFGASSPLYRDRTFWDADCWILPALALIEPRSAAAIGRMRVLEATSDVYADWVRQERPTATSSLGGGVPTVAGRAPLKFAWQSGARGHEQSEEPTRFEEHVSGDVAWGLDFAANLGLADRDSADSVIERVAQYYAERARRRSDGMYGIPDVVSVDEWHTGDDCTYTNAVADWVLRKARGRSVWPNGAMYFPRDDKGLLAYQGDTRRAYQQASALLLLWPLEREDLVDDPVALLDLFQGKAASSGPAMTASVEALIRARYDDPQRAYTRWLESWQWYVRGNPFLLFSEKPGQHDRTYFGTGAAGCLNAVLYGFAGARIVDDASRDQAKIAVAGGKWLVFRPNLPRQWRAVTLQGFTVMGKRYDVRCAGRSATVTPHKEESRLDGPRRRFGLQGTG